MNYKKAYLNLKNTSKVIKEELDKRERRLKNIVLMTFISGLLFNFLDKLTPIPMSIEDGLSFNLYLLPMVFVGLFYLVYGYLWQAGKVKGRLMIF